MEPLGPAVIQIDRRWVEQMQQHVSASTKEVCGILGGRQAGEFYQVLTVVPVKNSLDSATRFKMDPVEQLRAMLYLEEKGLDLVAIYHSHPDGPKSPSQTDVAEAYYPEAVQIIWAKEGDVWGCSAYLIQDGLVSRIEVQEIIP
jgi:proteasome lid subunit RPN8/RPN11